MNTVIENTAIVIGFDKQFVNRFQKTSLIVGIILLLVGLAGTILPQVMSLVSAMFIGWLMLLAGALTSYMVFLSHGRSMITWLKPLLLFVTGALLLFYPLTGIAAMALLLTFYMMLDAVSSFGLAHDYYPIKGWGWMVFNGVSSLALALLLLVGWPAASAMLLGIYIGISLLFDGLALVFMSLAAKKALEQ